MKTLTKVLAAIISAVTLAAQIPAVQQAVVHFFTAHPAVSTIIGGVSAILTLFHVPTNDAVK